MGNAILCRNAPCTQPRPVYKTVLQQIFQIAVEKPKTEPGSTKNSTIDNMETTASKTSPDQIDVPKLQAHVKSHIKGLIDYLEGSHNKLIDTGNYLHKVVTGSFNPDIHMLGLLVIIELLDASSKFTHDKNFLAKLHQRSGNDGEEGAKGENKAQKKASKDLENSSFLEYGQSLRGNVLQFEDNVVEILSFLLDGKKNPFRKSSYKHVLIALNLFAQNHLGTVSPEKGETILKDALEMIDTYQQWNEKETLEVQCQFMELVITMTKTSIIAFKFKQKFINHICSTLKMCYEQNSENNLLASKSDSEIKELKDRIIKFAFEGITALTQSVYDLNEFGIMVTPLFSFFDNIEWKTEKLQTDIFISLIESMNQTSFEQVEIFFVDKIVDYVDHDPTSNPYKHNNDTGVKIRMFSLLGTIFERAKKTFLSFLVIDNITLCFLNNLRDHYTLGEEGKQLKDAIYNCHRQFIEKIDRSSKNLSQLLSSIAAQTLSAAFKDSKDEHFISAALEFFDFTLDEISSFPGQYFVQKECMTALIRIRTINEHSQKAYRCIEKLLAIRCATEEGYSPKYKRMESKKTELLNCPPDLVYSILNNNLTAIKESLEHPVQHSGEYDKSSTDFLKFILHCVRINHSLILRRDNVTLMILLAFIKKIIELATRENTKNPNKGLLFYVVSNFFKQLQTEWNIDPISSPTASPAQIQPFITLDFMQKENDVSNQECQKILHELEAIDAKKTENYEKEFNKCLESILNHMKTLTAASTFENLNTDFEDLGSQYGGNAFISIDDGDSHRIDPSVDHNNRSHLTDGTPKPSYQQGNQSQKRGGTKQVSLISIGQIRDQNSIMKGSQANNKEEGALQDESDPSGFFIDKSFENALKEAKKNKAKTNNLTKILNNQI